MSLPSQPTLTSIFAATVLQHPDAVALDVPPGRGRPTRRLVSYQELDASARALASRLDGLVGPGAIVAILLPRESTALYAAQLAALNAGAAFMCLDPRFPGAHLRAVLADAQPSAVISDRLVRDRLTDRPAPTRPAIPWIEVDDDPFVPAASTEDPPPIAPDALAYVIYTSGTTGEPKGVMVEHRAIANLVEGDRARFGLGPGDRVAQCSSPAYDSSIEEAWLAFGSGAALVLTDDDTIRGGPALVEWLREEAISVFCPSPTLLRATGCQDPSAALPDLRLLYVGGEALPQDLADRWSKGRAMVNGYGPTECAVTSLRADVRAGRPVTIGRPVPGAEAWVLDDALEPVPDGSAGELCLGGACLARGYLGRPSLTEERFPVHPRLGRLYRTGDLVRALPDGEIEYLGRIDSQVKLRGYRIELGAVESSIQERPGVRAAACRVQGDGPMMRLAAHVVPETPERPPDLDALAADMRRDVPEYMVPSLWGLIDALPTTVGGKLDRNALPALAALPHARLRSEDAPRDELESWIASAFAAATNPEVPVARHADFFVDLGGDSLSAALVLLELGLVNQSGAHGLGSTALPTYRDLYQARTVAGLAAVLRERDAPEAGSQPEPDDTEPSPPTLAPWQVGLMQAGWLLGMLVAGAAIGYGIFLFIPPVIIASLGFGRALLLLPVLAALGPLLLAVVSVVLAAAAKTLLIGRYRAGRYPVWSSFYVRHWLVTQAARAIPWGLFQGTLFSGVALRALGADVGREVHVHRGVPLAGGGWDLLEIGDGVTLAQDASPRTAELEDGHVVIGPVTIGAGATLDVRAGMSPNSALGAGAMLTPLSWLPGGCAIPDGERWDGVPATAAGRAEAPGPPEGDSLDPLAHGLLVLGLGALLRAAATLPTVAFGWILARSLDGAESSVLGWLAAPSPRVALPLAIAWPLVAAPAHAILSVVILRLLGRVDEGVFPIRSIAAIRLASKTRTVADVGRMLSGSLYWPHWLRAAGMRIGRRAEISTIIDVVPETIAIGDESFLADGIYLCAPHVTRGRVRVSHSRLGGGTFLGNHVVVPAGARYPEDLFVGVSTVVDAGAIRESGATAWFGHPPFELPRREVARVDRRLTYEPGPARFAVRLCFESLRFALPALPLVLLTVWMWAVVAARGALSPFAFWSIGLPAITFGATAASVLSTVLLKWSLLGRVRPGRHAFWSGWCARWDFVYMAWGAWARRSLSPLEGTPFLAPVLRLFGMRIGRRVILGGGFAQVVDPDMIRIDDDATVDANFQAHTFEDRVLKIDRLRIRAGATVGQNSVVFYGVDVGEGATVAPHSVVMKRDRLSAGRRYAGSPTYLQPER